MLRKILLGFISLFFACAAWAQTCPGPSQRTALLNLQKSVAVEGTKAGQIPLTDTCGNQRYAQYVEVNLDTIAYTPTPTGNTSNLSEFVIDPTGAIFYIDWQGNSIEFAGGAAACDADWLQIADNACPDAITDSIYTYKYASIGARYVWPTAELLVNDSLNAVLQVIQGNRNCRLAFYDINSSSWSMIDHGSGTDVYYMPNDASLLFKTSGGTPQAPGGTQIDQFEINAQDSTIRAYLYPNTRVDTAAIEAIFYPDANGVFRVRPVGDIPGLGANIYNTDGELTADRFAFLGDYDLNFRIKDAAGIFQVGDVLDIVNDIGLKVDAGMVTMGHIFGSTNDIYYTATNAGIYALSPSYQFASTSTQTDVTLSGNYTTTQDGNIVTFSGGDVIVDPAGGGGGLTVLSTLTGGFLDVSTANCYMGNADANINFSPGEGSINLSSSLEAGTGFLVTDARTTTKGIEYAANYGAGFTDRTLIDRAYAAQMISDSLSGGGGGANIYNTSSVLTADRFVNQGGFVLNFGEDEITYADGTFTKHLQLNGSDPTMYMYSQHEGATTPEAHYGEIDINPNEVLVYAETANSRSSMLKIDSTGFFYDLTDPNTVQSYFHKTIETFDAWQQGTGSAFGEIYLDSAGTATLYSKSPTGNENFIGFNPNLGGEGLGCEINGFLPSQYQILEADAIGLYQHTDPGHVYHIIGVNSVAPGVSAGSGAGTSATASVVSAQSGDIGGRISFTTGSGAIDNSNPMISVTFDNAYTVTPIVQIGCENEACGIVGAWYVSTSTTGFEVFTGNTAINALIGTSFNLTYTVMQGK